MIDLGHTRIAHIHGPDFSTSLLRTQGYVSALRDAGLRVRKCWMVPSNFRYDGGTAAMKRLLRLTPQPTAVFAGNDPSAFGAIEACQAAGLEVPGDISIIGAGAIEGPHQPYTFLTTVASPACELGKRAAEMLLREIAGRSPSSGAEFVYRPKLLIRRSTQCASS